jgi:hypothetical protein
MPDHQPRHDSIPPLYAGPRHLDAYLRPNSRNIPFSELKSIHPPVLVRAAAGPQTPGDPV